MRRLSNLATILLFLGTLVLPAAASAETIVITSGVLAADRLGGQVTLEGPGGFRVEGTGSVAGGRLDPHFFCDGTIIGCPEGSRTSLFTSWSGSDFTGTATVDGSTFPIGMGSQTAGSAFVEFSGSFLVPQFTGDLTRSVVAPFLFKGGLSFPDSVVAPAWIMSGQGLATISLLWRDFPDGGWEYQAARFEFAEAAPVPEPATLVLVGAGLAGLIRGKVRKRTIV